MNHTPGPWRWNQGALLSTSVGDAWGSEACLLHGLAHKPLGADARLIAAVPELLEALVLAEDALQEAYDISTGLVEWDREKEMARFDQAITVATAAIAKARSEQ